MECILMKWLITEYKERLAYIRLLIVHFFRYRPIVALFLSLVQDTCHVLVSRYTWENHARVGVKKKKLWQPSNTHFYHWLFKWHETFDNSSTSVPTLWGFYHKTLDFYANVIFQPIWSEICSRYTENWSHCLFTWHWFRSLIAISDHTRLSPRWPHELDDGKTWDCWKQQKTLQDLYDCHAGFRDDTSEKLDK